MPLHQLSKPPTPLPSPPSVGPRGLQKVSHVQAIAYHPPSVRITQLPILVVIFSAIMSNSAIAHEPKEFTILLTDEGMNPATVPDDVLVATDSLFFVDVDNREGVRHRIQFDADGDGVFEGPDDLSTAWLTSSCELDENGSKVLSDCMVAESILLGPQNGILPGNVSMLHQIETNSSISDEYFSVFLNEDTHADIIPEIQTPIHRNL